MNARQMPANSGRAPNCASSKGCGMRPASSPKLTRMPGRSPEAPTRSVVGVGEAAEGTAAEPPPPAAPASCQPPRSEAGTGLAQHPQQPRHEIRQRTHDHRELGEGHLIGAVVAHTARFCQFSGRRVRLISVVGAHTQAVASAAKTIAVFRICCQRLTAAGTCWRIRNRHRRKFRNSS